MNFLKALTNSDKEVARRLCRDLANANVNDMVRTDSGPDTTALMLMLRRSRPDWFRAVLSMSEPRIVNFTDNQGNTVLHVICLKNRVDCLEAALRCPYLDWTIKNFRGETGEMIARRRVWTDGDETAIRIFQMVRLDLDPSFVRGYGKRRSSFFRNKKTQRFSSRRQDSRSFVKTTTAETVISTTRNEIVIGGSNDSRSPKSFETNKDANEYNSVGVLIDLADVRPLPPPPLPLHPPNYEPSAKR